MSTNFRGLFAAGSGEEGGGGVFTGKTGAVRCYFVGKSGVKLGESRTHTSSQLTHSGITISSEFIWFIKRQKQAFFTPPPPIIFYSRQKESQFNPWFYIHVKVTACDNE